MFIPDSPYFVGLFLCHDDDKRNHPYVGSYFKKGGRYVCADKPTEGVPVIPAWQRLPDSRTWTCR
jgi:hypothetical protein